MSDRIYLKIDDLSVFAFTFPTDFPEAEGTLHWNSTTVVVVEVTCENIKGIGYTYANKATAQLINDLLKKEVIGQNPMDIPHIWEQLIQLVRNLGRPGICSMAIAAVDSALWDLKAKLLNLPLAILLGRSREAIPVYGSGGFTSYSLNELQKRLQYWTQYGITKMKIKVGEHPEEDINRVEAARNTIGDDAELFVDANGAYSRKEAVAMSEAFADFDVTWFEEPVTSDNLEGLRYILDHAPANMEIAAGEYGYDLFALSDCRMSFLPYGNYGWRLLLTMADLKYSAK